MSIGRKAAKGFIRLFQRNMLEKLMGLTTIIILARKLTPYDFGLVSITEVLLYTISVFGSTGISEYLLAYKGKDTKETFKAAFWFNIILTLAILLVFLAAAPLWAKYQDDNRIINISLITGGIFVASQLSIIPKTWLGKNLQFDKQVKIQAPFIILIPLAKVAAVFAGWGVYSLVLPTLIFIPIQTLTFYIATKFRPGFHLYIERWKEIYGFTKHLIGSALLRRLADQGDKFIIGKMLGLSSLGIYNIAMKMAELFTQQLIMVSNNVLMSVLPKYADDKERLYTQYISFLKTFSFLMLPFMGIMLIAAKPIILLLYGEKWIGAVVPMQILLVYSALRSVTSSFSVVMNTYHLNKEAFKINMYFTPTHLIASAIGATFGIVGVAAAVVLVRIIFYHWRISFMMRSLGMLASKWLKDIAPFFVSIIATVGIAWAGSYGVLYMLGDSLPVVRVMLTSLAVLVIYNVMMKLIYPRELSAISHFLGATYPKVQGYFKSFYRI